MRAGRDWIIAAAVASAGALIAGSIFGVSRHQIAVGEPFYVASQRNEVVYVLDRFTGRLTRCRYIALPAERDAFCSVVFDPAEAEMKGERALKELLERQGGAQ